ncbi:MAG: MFS transporter [Gemmataceae bacterium]|nr:MFS transporter [Gemmataceae bacterium]
MNEEKAGQLWTKISWRILPLLFLSYIGAYLDRINVGFASKHLKSDLQFSDSVYGLGAGIFFLGYALFEIPSNMILEKVGARRWIARIMVSWAVLSSAMAFVNSEKSFYILRFLLGLAEAGFFPGIILYLTYWFPPSGRGRAISRFMTAIPLSGLIGAPLSGILLDLDGLGGLHGWQWMFLLEALPSLILGIYIFYFLPDGPANAAWLSPQEKEQLAKQIQMEEEKNHSTQGAHWSEAFRSPRVWQMGAVYFFQIMGMYGISLWLAEILHGAAMLSNIQTGLFAAIPFLLGTVAMAAWGWNSDRLGERRWHLVLGNLFGACGFFLCCLQPGNFAVALTGMIIASMGVHACFGPFWALKTTLLGPALAAVGIALINSLGNLGGFVGPYLMGYLRDLTGSLSFGLFLFGLSSTIAAGLALTLSLTPVGKEKGPG